MKYLFHGRTAYYRFRKVLLIMRLTAILILIGCLHAGAEGFAQTIDLSVASMPLDRVFGEIEKQTGYYFVYAKDLKEKRLLVSVEIKHATLEKALHKVFEGLPFTWQVIDNVVVVKTAYQSNTETRDPEIIEVKGRVINTQGEPLMTASVVSKETKRGTATNANGEFKIYGLKSDDILLISYTGYKTVSLRLANQISYTIVMETTEDELDKTVVQAYGMTSRRLATGNIGVVRAKEIENQPVMNPLMALQGKVAGLVITPNNGYASGIVRVELRGRNTVDNNFITDPLYIIDGVPLTVLDVAGTNNYGVLSNLSTGFDQTGITSPAGGQSPFFSLNPMDIESIEVLKDADATAIYGSRGANGVILITTKKGKAGKTRLDLNIYQGGSKVTRHWDILNSQQYLEMRKEAFKNDVIIPTKNNAPDLLTWDTTRFTDWQKYLWGKMGKTTDFKTDLSGGNTQTTFRVGAGYHHETDITTYNGINQKASILVNLNHHSINQKFSISFIANYSYARTNMVNISGTATLPPNAPPVFNDKGSLNFSQWDASGVSLPFSNLLQPYDSKTNYLNSNITLNFQIINGLTFKTSFGYNNAQTNQTKFTPIAAQNPANNPTGSAQFGNNRNTNWIVEPQLEYNRFISKGKLNVLVGGSTQATTTDGLFVIGTGYNNDALLRTVSNAPTKNASDYYGSYKYAGLFGRINYNWENKYIISLNARRDGSSRFGSGKQFGNFGSLGVAWILSEENLMKRLLPAFINFAKFRGSYGTTGGDGVGDYKYLSQWGTQFGLFPYNGTAALAPLIQPNPNFHWQVNKKLEVAMDLGFLKEHINFEVAYFRNRCDNQLLPYPTPEFTGFTTVIANSPANVQNSGWEYLVNAKIVDQKMIKWSFNFNFGFTQNKLLAYPNIQQSTYKNGVSVIVGQSLNILHLLHYTGVDPQTGQYTFQDKNHDGRIVYNFGNHLTDDSYIHDLNPRFSGGLGNSFSYKNLNLFFFFYFKKQIGFNGFAATTGIVPGSMNNISIHEFNNRWQHPGDISNVARFTTAPTISDNNFLNSDGKLTDASFIRLANLSISYNLNEVFPKRAGMQSFQLFFQGENLFVITKYKGLDPETQNFGSMPPIKTFTTGIKCSF